MANMLSDASRWTDNAANSPPAVWTGALYAFIGDDGTANTINAVANDGDTINFILDNMTVSETPTPPTGFQVQVNGTTVYSYDLTVVGSATFNSDPLSSGDTVKIFANTQFVFSYSVDFTLTPIAVIPPATPGKGFVLATGDDVSPSQGPGSLTTLDPPRVSGALQVAATYVRTPQGIAAVLFGVSPVLTMQLPEDVGEITYLNTPKQRYTWRSKKFVFPGMTTFGAAKVVHSCQGGGVKFRLFVDCCCVYQTVVRGCVPFRLPAQLRGITAEIELSGCSRVTEVRLASSIRELMGDE